MQTGENDAKGIRMTADSTLNDQILGVYETHLTVRDLATSVQFYQRVLGLELARQDDDRGMAFFWVGGKGQGMLGLWSGGAAPMGMRLHFAFRSSEAGVWAAFEALKAAGVGPLGFHGEAVSEPVVIGWMPAISIYFKDPDGHSIEVIAVLDEAGDETFGVGSASDWRARGAG